MNKALRWSVWAMTVSLSVMMIGVVLLLLHVRHSLVGAVMIGSFFVCAPAFLLYRLLAAWTWIDWLRRRRRARITARRSPDTSGTDGDD